MDSYPVATSFHWTFNASEEQSHFNQWQNRRNYSEVNNYSNQLQEISLSSFSLILPIFQMTSPRFNYTPTSDADFGSVSCWARNEIGIQKNPCVFRIYKSARPSSLRNCTTSYLSPDSLQVDCLESFDGGMTQEYLLELVEVPTLRLVRKMSLQVSFKLQIGFLYV